MPDYEKEKLLAAKAAVSHVEDGMVLGLGSGSTVFYVIQLLGDRIQREKLKLRAVPSSLKSRTLAEQVGIPLVDFLEVGHLDLTIDGADEIDPSYRMIKGAGGALLHERIVASASERFIIACDSRKQVKALGAFPVPVEVVKFGWPLVAARISRLGGQPTLRTSGGGPPYLTDEQNYMLDCRFQELPDPQAIADALRRIPGVVDHGLFIGYPDLVIYGTSDGVDVHRVEGSRRDV